MEEIVKITKENWKSFQQSLPLAIQLRSKQRNKVKFYRCKDACGFTYKVKEYSNSDEIEIIMSNRSCHQDRVIPQETNPKGPVLKEIKETIISLVEIHKYFSV
jgi:hypothetical protein